MKSLFKLSKKVLSVVLTMSVACLYPIQVVAADNYEQEVNDSTILEATQEQMNFENDNTIQRSIIGEITSDREQYSKNFRMSDGSVMVAQYDYPVHFKNEKDEWVEYDNTLELDNSEIPTEESTQSEDNSEIVATIPTEVQTIAQTEPPTEALTEALTEISTETTTAETDTMVSHNNPTEKIDVQAETVTDVETISNLNENMEQASVAATAPTELVTEDVTDSATIAPTEQSTSEATEDSEENTSEYKNNKSDVTVKLANKSKLNNMFKIKYKDYQVSWGYKNANKSKISIIENKEQLTGDDVYLAKKNLVSQAMYTDVFDNVDLQCFVTPLGVKENLILKNNKANNEFELQYKFSNLTAVQKNEKVIELVNINNETIYVIEAPVMTDSNGEVSKQLQLTLVSQKNNKLTVKLTADKNWLADKNRKYPVTVDPSFITSQEWNAASSTYVDTANPNTVYGPDSPTGHAIYVYVGSYGVGSYRTYFKMNELPELNNGDMVVDARLNLHLIGIGNDFYENMYIGAYQVTEAWNANTMTYNNKANCSATVLDYETLVANETEAWHDWDITGLAKQWYSGTASNYGIMLKPVDEAANNQCAGFYSSSYYDTTPRPVIQITYRNNRGLEDYWTYSSFAVGTAGTAYINDYTGNLTFITNDMSTTGNFSTSVQHVFNNYMAGVKYQETAPYTGLGWKLNIQQTIRPSTDFCLEDDNSDRYPYVYTDADGTDHYFIKETKNGTTTYKDEDGLKLELTINTSDNNAYYTITDDKDNKLVFNNDGNLNKIVDSNGNTTEYVISSGIITTVKDDTANQLTTTRNSYNYITSITDPAGRTRRFIYTTNKLTQIQNPDGTSISFAYDTDGSITSITDIDGYKVTFAYTSKEAGKQVSAIQEYATDGTEGQKITFDRSEYNVTSVRSAGIDGEFDNSDDCISKYYFDNFGRTISISNQLADGTEMGASTYAYTAGQANSDNSNIKQLNRATTGYSAPSNVDNLLKGHNCEASGYWTSAQWSGTNTFTTNYTNAQRYYGQKSLSLSSTAYTSDSRARVYQDVSTALLVPGKTYTLSAYVKTTAVTSDTDNSGAMIGASAYLSDGTWSDFYSEHLTGTTDTAINNGWRRVTLTFKVPSTASYTRINLALRAATGTAYFDGVQLEEGTTANTYNLLQNPSLERVSTSTGMPSNWSGYGLTSNTNNDYYSTAQHFNGNYSFMITGDHEASKWIYQTVPVSGVEDDTYIVSGWAKANAVPEDEENTRKFKISVEIKYSDGTSKFINNPAEFNHSISSWQYSSATFNLSDGTNTVKTPVSITVYLNYSKQANKIYFDNVQLIKDATQSYTYNSDGELVSVVSNAEQKSTMEYSDSNLTKVVEPTGSAYEYEYDDKHNMKKATSQRGVTYNYTYNTKGQATDLEAKNASNTMALKSNSEYTSNGEYLQKLYDQDGNYDTYNYDATKGFLTSVVDNNTGATINYTYNTNNGNLLTVTQSDSQYGLTMSNSYGYSSTGKLLTQISRNGTNYNIEYDAFNNVTNNKVGTQTLSKFTYDDDNGVLKDVRYGTGESFYYNYDNYGNVRSLIYNGSTNFEWFSDKSGAVIRSRDLVNSAEYNYDYDTTGRLVRQSKTNTSLSNTANRFVSAFEYGYDLNNNITKLISSNKYDTITHQYTYGKDNLLEKYVLDGGRQVTYSYDGLNRNTSITLNTERPLITSYTYWLSNRNTNNSETYRTTKIHTETIDGRVYYYTYDTNGNIIKIQEKVNGVLNTLQEYQYDKFNQMVCARDYENHVLYNYVYDEGGNILRESIQSNFDSTDILPSSETIDYAYTDTNWKDKMTEYNGQTITYDRIGNPLTYRDGMTMTWKRGRQLTTLQTAENSIQYKYDSDSIRTTKIVNGVVHTYEYLGGLLMHETRGEQAYDYYYDANGQLYAVSYKLSENDTKKVYYFTHNWRGDIVGIYNGNGDLKATYSYDAWGNVTAIEDANGNAITSATHIANLNPFRYRGYYMDTETGLYYLMSRYYDPVTHRFLNADGYFQSGGDILDTNMNAYCRNNPVNLSDPTGEHSCGDPTCRICRSDRRDFLRTERGMKLYNDAHGTNYIGVKDNGDFILAGSDELSNTLSFSSGYLSTPKGIMSAWAGACAETGFCAGVASGIGYAVTTPLSIASHVTNPYLTETQKGVLLGMEVGAAVGGIALSIAISQCWNPVGWVAVGVSVACFAASAVTSSFISHTAQSWEDENKESWLVK